MKEFLVLLVFIWATHASEPAQFGADSNHGQGLDHVRLDDGVIGDNVVGSVEGSAHLQKVERHTRDVTQVLTTYTTLETPTEDAGNKEDNTVNQSELVVEHKTPQHVGPQEFLKRSARDVVHVLGTYTTSKECSLESLETGQTQSAVVARHKIQQHVVELNKQTGNPQEYLERPARDVIHIIGSDLGDKDRKEDNSENLAAIQPQSAVVDPHKTPQHVVELIKQNVNPQEYLERPVRDVAHALRPGCEDVNRKEDNSENIATSQPQLAVVAQHKTPQHVVELTKQHFATQEYLERPARDVVHLLRPGSGDVDKKENKPESQSAVVAQQQQPTQHVAEFMKQLAVPQESLERPARDATHLLKPQNPELSREDRTENSAQYPLPGPDVATKTTWHGPQISNQFMDDQRHNFDSLKDVDVGARTSKWDHNLEHTEKVHHQAAAISDHSIQQHVAEEHPNPLTEQDQAAPETFTTLAPRPEEDLKKDFTVNTTGTVELQSVPNFQPTPQHVAREIIKQVALQNHLQRHVRDVKHLFKPRTRLPSLFKKGNGNSENSDTVPLQSDNVAELELERQVRDVAHLYGTHTTLTSRNDLQLGIEDNPENAEKFQFAIPEVVQSLPYISQATNKQHAVEQNQVERHRRNVRHFDGSSSYTILKPHTKDQATKEVNYAEDAEQKIGSQERPKRAVEVQYKKSPSSGDNIKHSSEDSIGGPSTIFDQIVEDDHYVEQHVAKDLDPHYVPAIKEPSFDKKTKRWVFNPSENIGQIPEYIQKVAQVEAEDHNDATTSSTIPDSATQKPDPDLSEANKRVARSPAVPVNDPGEIQNCDHIKSQHSQHGLKTAEPNEANKRIVRSSDAISTSDCVEVSTANPQHVNVVTTTPDKVDVRELLKPTVKVQIQRLPLTAFAQRNTMTKTTRRYPDVAVTVPPKGAKRKY